MGRTRVWEPVIGILFAATLLITACGGGGGGGRDSRLFFNADDGNGRELWVLDKAGSLEMIDIDATSSAS
ncbi:MAG: hypothetical protein JSV00_03310, partial [bacterium]